MRTLCIHLTHVAQSKQPHTGLLSDFIEKLDNLVVKIRDKEISIDQVWLSLLKLSGWVTLANTLSIQTYYEGVRALMTNAEDPEYREAISYFLEQFVTDLNLNQYPFLVKMRHYERNRYINGKLDEADHIQLEAMYDAILSAEPQNVNQRIKVKYDNLLIENEEELVAIEKSTQTFQEANTTTLISSSAIDYALLPIVLLLLGQAPVVRAENDDGNAAARYSDQSSNNEISFQDQTNLAFGFLNSNDVKEIITTSDSDEVLHYKIKGPITEQHLAKLRQLKNKDPLAALELVDILVKGGSLKCTHPMNINSRPEICDSPSLKESHPYECDDLLTELEKVFPTGSKEYFQVKSLHGQILWSTFVYYTHFREGHSVSFPVASKILTRTVRPYDSIQYITESYLYDGLDEMALKTIVYILRSSDIPIDTKIASRFLEDYHRRFPRDSMDRFLIDRIKPTRYQIKQSDEELPVELTEDIIKFANQEYKATAAELFQTVADKEKRNKVITSYNFTYAIYRDPPKKDLHLLYKIKKYYHENRLKHFTQAWSEELYKRGSLIALCDHASFLMPTNPQKANELLQYGMEQGCPLAFQNHCYAYLDREQYSLALDVVDDYCSKYGHLLSSHGYAEYRAIFSGGLKKMQKIPRHEPRATLLLAKLNSLINPYVAPLITDVNQQSSWLNYLNLIPKQWYLFSALFINFILRPLNKKFFALLRSRSAQSNDNLRLPAQTNKPKKREKTKIQDRSNELTLQTPSPEEPRLLKSEFLQQATDLKAKLIKFSTRQKKLVELVTQKASQLIAVTPRCELTVNRQNLPRLHMSAVKEQIRVQEDTIKIAAVISQHLTKLDETISALNIVLPESVEATQISDQTIIIQDLTKNIASLKMKFIHVNDYLQNKDIDKSLYKLGIALKNAYPNNDYSQLIVTPETDNSEPQETFAASTPISSHQPPPPLQVTPLPSTEIDETDQADQGVNTDENDQSATVLDPPNIQSAPESATPPKIHYPDVMTPIHLLNVKILRPKNQREEPTNINTQQISGNFSNLEEHKKILEDALTRRAKANLFEEKATTYDYALYYHVIRLIITVNDENFPERGRIDIETVFNLRHDVVHNIDRIIDRAPAITEFARDFCQQGLNIFNKEKIATTQLYRIVSSQSSRLDLSAKPLLDALVETGKLLWNYKASGHTKEDFTNYYIPETQALKMSITVIGELAGSLFRIWRQECDSRKITLSDLFALLDFHSKEMSCIRFLAACKNEVRNVMVHEVDDLIADNILTPTDQVDTDIIWLAENASQFSRNYQTLKLIYENTQKLISANLMAVSEQSGKEEDLEDDKYRYSL